LIKIVDLHKKFKQLHVLKGVNLEVKKGEVLAIIGPSGSGKSTLLRCVNLLEEPTSGHIYLDGQDITSKKTDKNKVRQKIGMVFQSFNLFPHMSSLDNVTIALKKVLKMKSREAEEIGINMLKKVGLSDKIKAFPNQLSGGQKQRVAIARSLVNNPSLILADEPTGALDSKTSLEIMAVIQQLNIEKGITVVIVTHEKEISLYCRRIINLKDGRIIGDTPVSTPRNAAQDLAHFQEEETEVAL